MDIRGFLFSLIKPAAPSGSVNLPFQVDINGPNTSVSVSAPILVGDTGSGGAAGLAPAPAAGDGAATKWLKATGAWLAIVASDLAGAIFGASGTGHSVGAVPDPGATAGTTRFLREDATWATPAAPSGMATQAGVQQQSYTYAADTGSANAYAVSLTPAPTIGVGSEIEFKATNASTGASTLAVNGGTAHPIKKAVSSDLGPGDIVVGQLVRGVFDGTNWQMTSPGSSGSAYKGAWSALTVYNAGDFVTYSGALYMRLVGGGGASTAVLQSRAAVATHSLAFTSNVTTGSLLVVAVAAEQTTSTFTTPTDTLGTTYALADGITGQLNNIQVYYGIAPSTGANTVSFTNPVGGNSPRMTISEISNTNAVVNAHNNAYNSTTPSTVSLTTTASNCLIYAAIAGFHSANSYAAATGYTLTDQANGGDAIAGLVGTASSAGSYTPGFNVTFTPDNAPMVAVAFTTGATTPNADTTNWIATGAGGGGGTGTVTSVALTMPSDFTVTGSPITISGTLAVTGGVTKSGVQQEAYTYAADTGTANAYAVTLTPAPTLVAGSAVTFKAANANTGASTLAVNGGAATAIKKNGNSTALASGDIALGQVITAKYDGTVWQILAPGSGGGSSITLQTNGTNNGSQSTLNLAAGTNVTLTDNGTGTVTVAATGAGSGDYVLISTNSPSGTNTVTFSSLGSYRDLIVVVRGASTASATFTEVHLRYNGDTGNNYDQVNITVNNATMSDAPVLAGTYHFIGWLPAATGVANMGAAAETRIFDYANTTFQKAAECRGGIKLGNSLANFYTTKNSLWWRNTAAITSVTVVLDVGNFVSGSKVSLYGVN